MADTSARGAPLPFRMLIDEAAELARRNLRSVWVPIALPVAGVQALFSVVQMRWMSGWMTASSSGDPSEMFGSFIPFFGLSMLFGMMIGLIYVSMYATCVDIVAGRKPDVLSRVRFVVRLRVIVTLFAAGICIVTGFIACIIPGLVVALLLSFIVPVMVEENEYVIDAFSRSGTIATYNPHRSLTEIPLVKVFVLGVISVLLSYAFALLVQVPLAIVQQVLLFREIDPTNMDMVQPTRWMWLQVPSQVLGSLANTAIQFYVAFGIALLYFDLRKRREGSDIEAALEQLASPESPDAAR